MPSLYYDYRLGGVPRAMFGDARKALMRVPDEILQSVAFIATQEPGEDPSERRCRGTAFFVGVYDFKNRNSAHVYLVTAKHCVAKAIEEQAELYVRVNTIDGGCEYVRISGDWLISENPSVDLAVLPFFQGTKASTLNPVSVPYIPIMQDQIGDEKTIKKYAIGIGDETVIAGLFTRRAGREKNLPIVRVGCIAATPSELLPDPDTGLDFHAYLVEARSIGGLSGSPVFAYIHPHRHRADVKWWQGWGAPYGFGPSGYAGLILIGVIRGHWPHKEPIPFASAFRDEMDKINWGIATVTPASYLADILFSESLVSERKKKERKRIEEDAPVSDFAEKESKAEPQLTKEQFESVLKTVSRKIESGEKS